MQAMNGSAISLRPRGRIIGCCMALVLALSALVLTPGIANAQPPTGGPIYMALGDSISFGYTEQKFNENYPTESPSQFEGGFPNLFNKDLHKENKGITLENFACPGETSYGLIGENVDLGGEKSTEEPSPPALYQGPGDWHPCAYHNVEHFPLHAGFGLDSQLEDAISVLTSENPYTGKPNVVKAITLDIGLNDEESIATQCKIIVTEEFTKTGKSKYGESPEAALITCINDIGDADLPRSLRNIADIITMLNKYYSGPIIVLGFYNPDSFVLSGSDSSQSELNGLMEERLASFANVAVANPFPIFNAGATAAEEQKTLCKLTEMCNPNVQEGEGKNPESPLYNKEGDPHPSAKGQKELAKLIDATYLSLLEKGV
jgi:lysophospholipase L1-like esterase